MGNLSIHIDEPDLIHMTQDCLATQTGISAGDLSPLGAMSVFHLAVTTFFTPSDISGTHGMRHECIHSTPSWRGGPPHRDCAFIVEDEEKDGMSGMVVVR